MSSKDLSGTSTLSMLGKPALVNTWSGTVMLGLEDTKNHTPLSSYLDKEMVKPVDAAGVSGMVMLGLNHQR